MRVHLGATIKYMSRSYADHYDSLSEVGADQFVTNSGVSADIGAMFCQGERKKSMIRAGAVYRLPVGAGDGTGGTFRLGASYGFPLQMEQGGKKRRITIAADYDTSSGGFYFGGEVEAFPRLLTLRAGANFLKVAATSTTGINLGFGITRKAWRLDYAYLLGRDELPGTHTVSLMTKF
jgi:hypothetical protein